MPTEKQHHRNLRIQQAAYDVLRKKGYASASMLDIAKAAKASNETLYRRFANKRALFKSLVGTNAAAVKAELDAALDQQAPPLETLEKIGPMLLRLLVSDRAISLNRAAAADPSGELGAVITEKGRETISPLIGKVFKRASAQGAFPALTVAEAVELYLRLLIGDIQIRRVIGAVPELTDAEIDARANRALTLLIKVGANR